MSAPLLPDVPGVLESGLTPRLPSGLNKDGLQIAHLQATNQLKEGPLEPLPSLMLMAINSM